MAWVCHRKDPVNDVGGPAFVLVDNDAPERRIVFLSHADSHAAGEAVRTFLGQPSLAMLRKRIEELESELAQLKRTHEGAPA